MAVVQFEFVAGLEFRVYAVSDRLKAELQTKLSHYQLHRNILCRKKFVHSEEFILPCSPE